MKILLGFNNGSKGSGTIFGKEICKDSAAIRSRIGYLSQDPRSLDYILTDVQRVSDTVAILNEGVCIAQGLINKLMERIGTVYSPSGRGDLKSSSKILDSLPWVYNVTCHHNQSTGKMDINEEVTYSRRAEEFLLRVLERDPGTIINRFGLRTNELEDTFFKIIDKGVK